MAGRRAPPLAAQRQRTALRENRHGLTIDAFNQADLSIDRAVLGAAGKPLLEHTLRPLRTLSRRIGWIDTAMPGVHEGRHEGLDQTLDCHLAVVDAMVAGQMVSAMPAIGRLIAFCDSMFDALHTAVDPVMFDCNLTHRAAG